MSGPLADRLGAIQLGTLAPKTLVMFSSTDSVGTVLKGLAEHKIISAPILEEGKLIGLVDMLDIIVGVMRGMSQESAGEIGALLWDGHRFADQRISSLLGASQRNPLVVVKTGQSLLDAAQEMAKVHAHRAVVVGRDDAPVSIVSQTDVARAILENSALIPRGDDAIRESSLASTGVRTVYTNTVAVDAYRYMHAEGLSAVAVINTREEIVDVLSASDLRGLKPSLFSRLTLPVSVFKKQMHSDQPPPPVTVTWDVTFTRTVRELLEKRVHRVYVVQHNKPVGVISLTDVIRAALRL